MPVLTAQTFQRQQGAGALEFIVVAVPILLVGLGTIELARWFFIKQAVSLALLEAGRAAIVDHARPATIESAFEHALLPLFPATSKQTAAQRLQQAFTRRQAATGVSPWQIVVRSPSRAAYLDFAAEQISVPGAHGLPAIDNNYQAEQHQRHIDQGYSQGRGPASGLNIFQANDLALDVVYMHEPSVPGMGALFRLMSATSSGYTQQTLAGGFLPIRQTIYLPMQSHPVAWRSGSDKVISEQEESTSWSVSKPSPACHGLWCAPTSSTGSGTGGAGKEPSAPGKSPFVPTQPKPAPPGAGAPPPGQASPLPTEPSTLPDDALCGVVLCCVGA